MDKRIAKISTALFFLFPIGGFVAALFNFRSKSTLLVFLSFSMLFGYAISFSDSSADSYRYAVAYAKFDNSLDYKAILKLYQNGELRDMYRLILFYISSLFSNNPKVMYAFAGLIYGIFSYLCLKIFVNECGEKRDKYVFILALIFFTFSSLSNINGFRFWTGGVFLFYATYKFIIEGKLRWVIGVLLTPLFHYGFLMIIPFILIYKLFEFVILKKNRLNPFLFYFFILSFLASWLLETSSIDIGFLTETEALSGAVGSRLEYVASGDVASLVENRRDGSLFLTVQKYFDYGIKIYILFVVIFLKKLLKGIEKNKEEYVRLFSFVLFFYSVSFIATSFPSGGRFLNIAHLFFFVLFVKFYVIHDSNSIKKMILWALPFFSFNILFTNGLLPLMILSPTFWFGNLVWIIIEGLDFHVY